jgi:hypothetical protein
MARFFAVIAACFLVPRLLVMLVKPYLIPIGILVIIYIIVKLHAKFFDD